ncbi:IS481 family transposase [Mycolicibacterium arenosum]|uniref:IS481 family transposase n=1 Tax=Mycolicibacterium arenosum TaxID=2952157 RepID=A0ABT1MCU5_9MYCO|nr:IS481 family transposase [Mycolicibacterium sp. CAU 1645]MCP9276998.1 IS481 family transposase [Mycolicibacterium sp. CAU 1645]
MAQKVTAMDTRALVALVGQVDNVTEFCREHQICTTTFYKLRRRFAVEGWDGLLHDRSRRPLSSPTATDPVVVQAVLDCRLELLGSGLDHGPQSIVWTLRRRGLGGVPSRATVARILSRHGLVVAQPRKRPKSATKRFVFARPNECWQSDWTEWRLADGTAVAIAGTLDDHSRYLPALIAAEGAGTTVLVWAVMLAGIAECGIPSMSLSDNGFVYTGRLRGYESTFEANLRALGVRTINSTPYHPQTCGKIERFWQTLKKWLAAHPPAATIEQLNEHLETFREHYNHQRPHRALGGATPVEAFTATAIARPADRPLPEPVFVSRRTVGQRSGNLFIAPYKVNVGLRWAGHLCDVIRDGDHITVYSGTTLVRSFTVDPTCNYQRGDKSTRTYRTREPQPASSVYAMS